ncbi:transcriptional regulator, AraC family [Lachnospiraceae bacterium KM106-2]|nr:transcriptional regulator, AraC family [Lachnospiraceae bacterium KM106-2]
MFEFSLHTFTQNEDFPFFIQYGKHEEDLTLHTHKDFSELVIVLSGQATHVVDCEEFSIKKGDVFVINANTSHAYQSTTDFKICNIMFRQKEILSYNYDVMKAPGFHALFIIEPTYTKNHSFTSRLKLPAADFLMIQKMIATMVTEYTEQKEGYQTLLLSYFLQMITLFSRLYPSTKENTETDILKLAQSVSYLEHHFTDELSIHTLASLSNYSERHFTRLFKEAYGTTPLEYILSLRIDYACSLLRQKRYTVTEIASRCGFNNSNYFYRIFKKQIGISPKAYEKNQY